MATAAQLQHYYDIISVGLQRAMHHHMSSAAAHVRAMELAPGRTSRRRRTFFRGRPATLLHLLQRILPHRGGTTYLATGFARETGTV